MRLGSLCSALLHGGLIALIAVKLADAGGAPGQGGGGPASFEVITSLPGAIPGDAAESNQTAPVESVADTINRADTQPRSETPPAEVTGESEAPPPQDPASEAARSEPPPAPPPAPVAEAGAEDLPPVPIGTEPDTPAPAAMTARLPEPLPPTVTPPMEETPPPVPAEHYGPRPHEPRLAEVRDEPTPTPPAEAEAEDIAPPEKPLRQVEVPAPQLKQVAKDTADTASAAAPAAPAGTQQAALAGDSSNQDLGSAGAPGAPGAATLGMSPGELQDYAGLLVAWLDRHKRYPDAARRRREEGVVVVEFAIDGRGRVMSHRLLGASGNPLLDAEAEALLARASPLPAPPDGAGRSFQVPIVFALR